MNEEWINSCSEEMDADLLDLIETITNKKHPNPFTPEGFFFILDEIGSRDWTWTLCKNQSDHTMTIYCNGDEVYAINKCLTRAVFICYADALIDSKNRK